jgi:hypothetical protein
LAELKYQNTGTSFGTLRAVKIHAALHDKKHIMKILKGVKGCGKSSEKIMEKIDLTNFNINVLSNMTIGQRRIGDSIARRIYTVINYHL